MEIPPQKGNLKIIDSDDDVDNKVEDEKRPDRDSALSDSIRSSRGFADFPSREDGTDRANESVENRDSALPDSPRDSFIDESPEKGTDLSDTLIGIPSIARDTEPYRLDQTSGASGQSDDYSSLAFGVDIKDEPQGPGNLCVIEESVHLSKVKDPIQNILASLPPDDQSIESMGSLTGGAFDPILSHKLTPREKAVKPKVHVPIDVDSQAKEGETGHFKELQTDDKGKVENLVGRSTPDIVEKDPATLSVKDKSSIFKKAPVPAPRTRKPPGIQSSVTEHHSPLEKEKETDKKEDVLKPRPKSEISQSFKTSLSFAEQTSKLGEDRKGEVLKPRPKSEISQSFKTSLSFAEQTSKLEEDRKGEVLKPRPKSEISQSFKTSLSFAEQTSKLEEGCRPPQIRQKPQPKRINPSFKAAQAVISAAPLKLFDSVKLRNLQSVPDGGENVSFHSVDHRKGDKSTTISGLTATPLLGFSDTRSSVHTKVRPEVTKEREKTKKDDCMVVAAMDFGTTYSAVAFSFKNDPHRILTHMDAKVPTVVLMDPDQNVHSFGDEAKTGFYQRFDDDETYRKWFYFECFKMKLYVTDKYFDKDIVLEDYSGKTMKALDVISKTIAYLRKQLLDLLKKHTKGVQIKPDSDVHWTLTVPAIWPDLSKAFMREAAEKAGIPRELLSLALEPEAASLYCKIQFGVQLRGKKYIVLDLGGGTADYVCHEVLLDDKIKECHMATGGDFGGKLVDNEFFKLFAQIYGGDVMSEFRKTKDYKEFCDKFELKKRKFDGGKDFTFKIPANTLNAIFERRVGEPALMTINQSPLKGKVSWRQDKIVIKRDLAIGIFDKAVSKIVETIKIIMERVSDIDCIIMVGGFSCSKYIDKRMKLIYPSDGFVKTPGDPQLAVVKGAVIFGQDTKTIVSRISKYTYGIGRAMIFKEGDPENRKFRANNAWWCEDCFCKHIEIGQEIGTDDDVKAIDYYPPDANVRNFFLEVFASTKKDPRYTNEDGCYSIGILRLEVDTQGDVWSKIEVKLIYKGTELELQAYDVKNKKLTSGKVEFWG